MFNFQFNLAAMRKIIYTLFIGVFAIAFTACKGGESVSTDPASLQGDWVITAMNGQEVPSDEYTVSFNLDGTVAGIAVCNRYAGSYEAQPEGVLSLSALGATKMQCESDTQSFLSAIQGVESFKVVGGDQLELTSADGTLVFSKVVTPGQEEG